MNGFLDDYRASLEAWGHRLNREWTRIGPQVPEEYLNTCVKCAVSFLVHRRQGREYLGYPNSWAGERVCPCTKSFARLAKEAEEDSVGKTETDKEHTYPHIIYFALGIGLVFCFCPRCGGFVKDFRGRGVGQCA